MNYYVKGKNVEPELELRDLPFQDLPANLIWIKVKPTTKMKTTIHLALEGIGENKTVVWTAIGPAIGKAISCAEIVKRRFPKLNQNTKIAYYK